MVIFHEKFSSNPDFICNYIKMKKEEEITRKLSLSKLEPNNDNKNIQKDQNISNEVEIEPPSELKATTSKKSINRVKKRSNSNVRTNIEGEVPIKKTTKTKNQQNRKVPVNTPISSNLTTIARHGRIISVKKFNIK